VNIDRWEKDKKQRLSRHYRLYVTRMPNDTVYHYSQRFVYDADGRLTMAWFDYMHLGKRYDPAGADTIWYTYDSRNRLVAERRRYTTDMRNKNEQDTTGLSDFEKQMRASAREKFFVGTEYIPKNNRVVTTEYQCEVFDPKKHLPLKIPLPR